MADAMFEIPDWAVAGFAAGVVNEHLRDTGDPDNDGCCPDCCAPCGALRWLRDNRRDELDDAVVAHLGMSWDWQNVDQIDWDSLAGRWGCQSRPACDVHPDWCAHRWPHPGDECSAVHRRDCACKPEEEDHG